jgi:pimeloyl-ACP methyl ester carboxylesterase
MILLHGHGNEAHLWDDFVPCVVPHYRVIAVDQRGHGDSDWDPEGRYDSESMADDLEALLAELEIDRFVLIGFSMGGRVSMSYAARHPERLAGLVLVDIGPEVDMRGALRIQGEVAENREPVFGSIEEYARMLSLNYPVGQPEALMRMARFGLRQREDGLYVLKMDPRLRAERPMDAAARAAEGHPLGRRGRSHGRGGPAEGTPRRRSTGRTLGRHRQSDRLRGGGGGLRTRLAVGGKPETNVRTGLVASPA